MAAALVAIPWQPHLFVAPSYLTRLERASVIAGHKIYLNSIKSPTGRYLSAWRALEEAVYLFDLYKNHGGAIASDPYKGKRYHLRGAGGDIRDRADRAAMLAAGFLPDPAEWWHFSDPNWASMPIIAINTGTAGNGTTAVSPTRYQEDDMKLWLYNKGQRTAQFILIDHLNMTYRTIPSGSLEHLAIQNDINAGARRFDEVKDPDWGNNFGNGQFRQIHKPAA